MVPTRNNIFTATEIPRLWNKLLLLNFSLSTKSIKKTKKLYEIFWSHFQLHFDPDNSCTFHYLCPCSSCSKLPLSHSLFSQLHSIVTCYFCLLFLSFYRLAGKSSLAFNITLHQYTHVSISMCSKILIIIIIIIKLAITNEATAP